MPKNDVKRTANFFNQLGQDYQKTVDEVYQFYDTTSAVILPYLKGKVLDIGSGGIDLFENPPVDMWVSYDLSPVLLEYHKKTSRLQPVCGESKTLPFADDSFDIVMTHFAIHHFAQESISKTHTYVKKCFNEMARICKPGGKIIVADNTVAKEIELIQKLLYPLMRWMLKLLKLPPAYVFSAVTMTDFFHSIGLPFKEIYSFKSASEFLVIPIPVPLALNPITMKIFIVKKHLNDKKHTHKFY